MDQDSSKAGSQGQAPPQPERLLGPLKLELRQGCMDKAATGGLEAFAQRWHPLLASKLAGYAALTPERREPLVRTLLTELQGGPAAAKPAKASKAVPQALEPAPSPALSAEMPLTRLPGLGPKRAEALRGLGLRCLRDVLHHYPRGWSDRSKLLPIAKLQEGQLATVQGLVLSASNFRTRSRLTITEVAIQDDSGTLFVVYFNQPYQQQRFKLGDTVLVAGLPSKGRRSAALQMQNPEAEVLPAGESIAIHTGRVVPLYELAGSVSQRVFRSAVWAALPAAATDTEPLPPDMLKRLGLERLAWALPQIHFPDSPSALERAKQRLVFDEFFLLALALEQRKRAALKEKAPALPGGGPIEKGFREALPFKLTGAQARVWEELAGDLRRPVPMQRLIQGDVGSGKTVLAALAAARALDSGLQAAIMAPTEILADQHLKNFKGWFEPLGVEVLRLAQGQKAAERREVLAHLASAKPLVVIGTQALIQEGVEFGALGLTVVDEQHRFGVLQRLSLSKKAIGRPHVLVMTATPIPRTLAMTVYGDLDVSAVDELPPGRTPVATKWLPSKKRQDAFEAARKQIKAGRQAYVVYALVDESDKSELNAATEMAEWLAKDVYPEFNVGLLHGKMKSAAKDSMMADFKANKIQVLCSTTVVEVGVDVPNATVMVIEDADRFGLAQLHQLRGRVGRGAEKSYCYMVADPTTDEGKARLKAMESSNDGFVIAEEDLRLRGPGVLLGTRQSGLPELRLADLLKDQGLLIKARESAKEVLDHDAELTNPSFALLKQAIAERMAPKVELGSVG